MQKPLKRLSLRSLAWANITRKPGRTAGLIALVAVLSLIVFVGTVFTGSLSAGLDAIGARFGADLIVVPEGSGARMEGILLQGAPGFFYIDQGKTQEVAAVEGIRQVSAQFYLTSVAADCCDMPVELIGFDPETDFTIQPWIAEVYSDHLRDGEVIIGADISPYNNGTVRFYNANYPVAAKLASTGTGLDQAVYANWNTLRQIFVDARRLGLGNIPDRDPERTISSILVRVEAGVDADQVARQIERQVAGVQAIRTSTIFGDISGTLRQLSGFLGVFVALFALTALFTLSIVFSVTAGERRKEFATLRTLGLTRGRLAGLLLREATLISGIGALLGTALGALITLPFSSAIGTALGLPYLRPDLWTLVAAAAGSILLALVIGPLAASFTARRISREETYLSWREGE